MPQYGKPYKPKKKPVYGKPYKPKSKMTKAKPKPKAKEGMTQRNKALQAAKAAAKKAVSRKRSS